MKSFMNAWRVIITIGAIFFGGLAHATTTQCAVVYTGNWQSNWYSSPQRAFCPSGNVGNACDLPTPAAALNCNEADVNWYQKAVDYAAPYYSSTVRPTVYLSKGTIPLSYVQSAWGFFGQYVGIHLKEGVDLVGSPSQYGTTVLTIPSTLYDSATNSALSSGQTLRALILVAKNRVGSGSDSEPLFAASSKNTINNVTLSGAVGGNTTCQTAASAGLTVAATSAILVGAHSSDLLIQNVVARHFSGNAFELGMMRQWTQDTSVSCTGNRLACIARRLRVQGNSNASPSVAQYNDICDAGLGGIAVVGRYVKLYGNHIQKVNRTWTNPATQNVGITMGISASFAGTTDIDVSANTLEDGDYNVGTDGSFPLFLDPAIFTTYWTQISAVLINPNTNYPNGPVVNNQVVLQGNDFVLGQQVLYDLASAAAIQRNDETGFGDNISIYNNTMSNAPVGVSLYRVKNSYVYNNIINSTTSSTLYGIDFNSTYNSFAYGNSVNWWPTGIEIRGARGAHSIEGSSYNGIGVVPPAKSSTGTWDIDGNDITDSVYSVVMTSAGWDNAVRSNVITSSYGGTCDYSGAAHGSNVDWTTDNVFNGSITQTTGQCNTNY